MANLAELIRKNPDLSLITSILESTNLLDNITQGEYTIFLPTNNAITQQLGAMGITQEEFTLDKKRLEEILKFHIISSRKIFSKDVKEDITVDSLQGGELDLTNENDNFTVNGINILLRDQIADNGVLHIIDRMLIPVIA